MTWRAWLGAMPSLHDWPSGRLKVWLTRCRREQCDRFGKLRREPFIERRKPGPFDLGERRQVGIRHLAVPTYLGQAGVDIGNRIRPEFASRQRFDRA